MWFHQLSPTPHARGVQGGDPRPPGVAVPDGTGAAAGRLAPGQSSAGADRAGEGQRGTGGEEEVRGTPWQGVHASILAPLGMWVRQHSLVNILMRVLILLATFLGGSYQPPASAAMWVTACSAIFCHLGELPLLCSAPLSCPMGGPPLQMG